MFELILKIREEVLRGEPIAYENALRLTELPLLPETVCAALEKKRK